MDGEVYLNMCPYSTELFILCSLHARKLSSINGPLIWSLQGCWQISTASLAEWTSAMFNLCPFFWLSWNKGYCHQLAWLLEAQVVTPLGFAFLCKLEDLMKRPWFKASASTKHIGWYDKWVRVGGANKTNPGFSHG